MPRAQLRRFTGCHDGVGMMTAVTLSSRDAMSMVCATLSLVLLAFATPSTALAAGGALDTSFGAGGIVAAGSFGPPVQAVAVQGDGKIVSVGTCGHDFCLTRHNVDGTLDTLFGVGGEVTTDISTDFDDAYAVALQADGKIVVAGTCDMPPSFGGDFCLVRYNTDGSLDLAFGAGGKVTTDFGLGVDPAENFDTANGVVIQPADGKIVASGTCSDLTVGVWRFCLARYNADGSLDGSFGVGGKVITSVRSSDDEAVALALQADGKLVVAGTCLLPGHDFCLARYNSNGGLDLEFGTGGKVSTDFGSGDSANAMTLQADGKIVIAGSCYIPSPFQLAFCLARYNADGSLDGSFGVDGKVTTAIGTADAAQAVMAQGDGSVAKTIVAAGFCYTSNYHFCLARYNPDGSPDAAFGIVGKVTTAIGTQDLANALAIQTDGNIVVGGSCSGTFCLARYLGAGTDQAPTDLTLSGSSIAESSPLGTAVGTFSTTDPDAGDKFAYSLVPGAGAADNASFAIAGSVLQASAVFDFETRSSYSVRVRTTDAGGLYFEKTFAISVTNVNESPTGLALAGGSIAENAPVGTAIGTFSTTDPDAGDTFAYSLVPGAGSADNGAFTIAGSVLQAAATYDFETKSSYSVRVRTTDAAGLYFEKSFAISVTNVNETPTDIALTGGSIPENSPVATAVGTFSATDPDAGDTFAYSLVPGAGATDNGFFTIAGGILEAAAVFDFEAKSTYSVRVRATDAGGLFVEKTFALTVTDVNEAPVAVNDSAITSKGNSVVIDVLANDGDPDGDPLTIVAVTQPARGSTTISSGMVTYAPKANYTGADSFTYTISDGKGLTAVASVSLSVITGNAPPRAVGDHAVTVADTAVIVPVLANDSDPDGDPLTILAVTQGAHGTVATSAGGTLTYTPAPGFTGHDSFTYTISDGRGGSDVGTVGVRVTKK